MGSLFTVVINTYGNRRLHDTIRSHYVNLDDFAGLIRQGKDVQVVNAKTARTLVTPTHAMDLIGATIFGIQRGNELGTKLPAW